MSKRGLPAGVLSGELEAWYPEHGRDLPWRRTDCPYAIWISEVMLQQTQVATVLPYYERWMTRFPDVAALAAASIDEVLKLWEGLGYYARGRRLHQAAQAIEAAGGAFPRALDEVMALPGVGRSTAGAICCFAYGMRTPLLDGNVRRVLARLSAEAEVVSRAAAQRRLWALSESLVAAAEDPQVLNQGLMELGALCCRPRQPDCEACPWQSHCRGRAKGDPTRFPVRAPRKAVPHHQIGVALIWRAGQLLVQRRPSEAMLGGLWEFPGGKQEPDETIEACVARECHEELGVEVELGELRARVDHAYSHFKITLWAFDCRLLAGEPSAGAADELRWLAPGKLDELAFPTANRRILDALCAAPEPLLRAAEGEAAYDAS